MLKKVIMIAGVVVLLGVTACAGNRTVIIEYPPREPIDRPRPGDRPTGFLPPQWESVVIRGGTEKGPSGETIVIPDNLHSVYRKGDGSIYVPKYEQEVAISGVIERDSQTGAIRHLPARKERRTYGGYWICGEPPVRDCKPDNPPPIELREREPRVITPPSREPGVPTPPPRRY